MSDSLQIEQGGGGECTQLRLIGRLDALGADRLEQEIEVCLRQGAKSIDLELAEVPYLSSAGIRTLLRTVRAVRARAGSLRLLHPSAVVQETLRLVGLMELLAPSSPPPSTPARDWVESAGMRYRVEMLEGSAPLQVERVGDPEVWPPRSVVSIPFPGDCFGFGLGALGDEKESLGRVGECLAAGGVAISLPAGDPTRPDYSIAQGELVPKLSLAYGLLCRGRFSHWVSFEAVEKGGSVTHAQLAHLALELSGASRAGLLVAGEIAGLVGAALLAQA
ncbi:MAG: STAS domain-containing protein, partial [bacterium]